MLKKKMEIYAYFVLILLAWGLWGFFGKYALKFINPISLILYETIGAIIFQITVLAFLFYSKHKFDANNTGISIAMLVALFGVIGTILFFFTLSKTKASVLVPLTALYPVVTVLLSIIFLKEKVTLAQGIGIALAVVASILLSV
ncbi:EamA family transporter [Candidatus Woesearchaeota archaeon]|nr:EamA family transporter [Candidatus Woesearchaeota archaeon]